MIFTLPTHPCPLLSSKALLNYYCLDCCLQARLLPVVIVLRCRKVRITLVVLVALTYGHSERAVIPLFPPSPMICQEECLLAYFAVFNIQAKCLFPTRTRRRDFRIQTYDFFIPAPLSFLQIQPVELGLHEHFFRASFSRRGKSRRVNCEN